MPGFGDETKRLALIADVVTRFHLILKIARIYEVGNALVKEHIGPLYRALTLLLQAEGAATLRVHRNALFFNQTRVRFDVANQPVLKFIAAEFEARGISAIAFGEGLGMDDLLRFVGALSGKPSGQPGAFERSNKRLEEARVSHISLEAIPAEAEEAGPKARAARAYRLGIRMLNEVIDGQKRQGGLSMALPRRWMQAMIRHLDEDESFCLGLTTLKNTEGYYANHGVNVAVLAAALGRRLGLPRTELAELGVSALTHDLGTIEVSSTILEKPAELTEAERALFDKQALLGARKLIPLQGGRSLPIKSLEVVMEHRLLMDQSNRGTGGARRSIHLYSRIVRIADAYDALTTRRVYRSHTFTPAAALKLMAGKSGMEFDPLLFKAFNAMLGPYPVGSLVALDDGALGVVVESNPRLGLAARPKTRLIADAEGRKMFGPVIDLAERTPDGRYFKRTIAVALSADAYGIQPADYFLASVR